MASRRSWVRIPSAPPIALRWRSVFTFCRVSQRGHATWVLAEVVFAMRDVARPAATCALSLLLWLSIGCSAIPRTNQVQSSSPPGPPHCPVTIPNGRQPPVKHFGGTVTYSPTYRGPRSDRDPGAHGNGKLWTVLPLDGKLLLSPAKDRSIGEKFFWWRGVRGRLTIRGRRLDAPADPLRSDVPEGYGETGFQASGVYFPSEGCWEITGKVADSELTFVLEVRVKAR